MPRLGDVIESNLSVFSDNLHVAFPAIIEAVNDYTTFSTIDVRPAINRKFSDGRIEEVGLLTDIPVQFPAGGGAIMSFPLSQGDDVLVICSDKSIDDWVASSGGTITPTIDTRHGLSDAFAIPSVFRNNNSLNPSATHVELKWDDAVIRITDQKNIQVETAGTFSVSNSSVEMLAKIIEILENINSDTVNTVYGASPLNSATATQVLINELKTLEE